MSTWHFVGTIKWLIPSELGTNFFFPSESLHLWGERGPQKKEIGEGLIGIASFVSYHEAFGLAEYTFAG